MSLADLIDTPGFCNRRVRSLRTHTHTYAPTHPHPQTQTHTLAHACTCIQRVALASIHTCIPACPPSPQAPCGNACLPQWPQPPSSTRQAGPRSAAQSAAHACRPPWAAAASFRAAAAPAGPPAPHQEHMQVCVCVSCHGPDAEHVQPILIFCALARTQAYVRMHRPKASMSRRDATPASESEGCEHALYCSRCASQALS